MTPGEQTRERRARLLAEVRAEPSPVRQEVRRRDFATIVAAAVLAVLVLMLAGGPHASQRPFLLVVSAVTAWTTIAAVATALALRRGRSMLGTPRTSLLAAAVIVPLLLALTWFGFPSSIVWTSVRHGVDIDARCFALTLALAAAPFVAFFVLRREGDPVRPGATGAALGASAGAWGAVLIDWHCELTDPRHVLLGHVLPVALLACVGALVARSLLTIRARA
jgi:hypothetical protein